MDHLGSPDHVALVRAVAAAPHDSLPKLVYADYLAEQNDPAEHFYRAHVAQEAEGREFRVHDDEFANQAAGFAYHFAPGPESSEPVAGDRAWYFHHGDPATRPAGRPVLARVHEFGGGSRHPTFAYLTPGETRAIAESIPADHRVGATRVADYFDPEHEPDPGYDPQRYARSLRRFYARH